MLHQNISPQTIARSHGAAAPSRTQSARGQQNLQPWLRNILVACAILLVMASFFVSNRHVSAQQSATLRCRVDKTTVAVDDNATLFIEVLDVADLYGYELTLKFNGSRIHFVDADPGKSGINLQVGDFLSPDFVVLNEANNDTGQATLALTQLSPSVAVSGTGELARTTLVGVAPGMVSFSFANVVLSDPAGVAIPVALQGCSIEVTGGNATATPTPTGTGTPTTPTPTPTPTPGGNDTGAIAGSVFLDENADGARQPSEGGLRAFVALYRLGTDRQWADMTDDNGDFLFSNLPAGRYFLEVRTLDGISYFYTTESTYDIQLAVGGSSFADFGLNLSGGRIWIVYMPQVGQDISPPAGTGNSMIVYLPVLSQTGGTGTSEDQPAGVYTSIAQVLNQWHE